MKIDIEVKTLSELRDKKGLTQRDVAKVLNMTPQGYGLIERGERELKARTAKQLADLFGVPVDLIVFFATNNNDELLCNTGTEGAKT